MISWQNSGNSHISIICLFSRPSIISVLNQWARDKKIHEICEIRIFWLPPAKNMQFTSWGWSEYSLAILLFFWIFWYSVQLKYRFGLAMGLTHYICWLSMLLIRTIPIPIILSKQIKTPLIILPIMIWWILLLINPYRPD